MTHNCERIVHFCRKNRRALRHIGHRSGIRVPLMEKTVFRLHVGRRFFVLQQSGKRWWEYAGRRLSWCGIAILAFESPYPTDRGLALFIGRWLLALTQPIPILRPRYELKRDGGR